MNEALTKENKFLFSAFFYDLLNHTIREWQLCGKIMNDLAKNLNKCLL